MPRLHSALPRLTMPLPLLIIIVVLLWPPHSAVVSLGPWSLAQEQAEAPPPHLSHNPQGAPGDADGRHDIKMDMYRSFLRNGGNDDVVGDDVGDGVDEDDNDREGGGRRETDSDAFPLPPRGPITFGGFPFGFGGLVVTTPGQVDDLIIRAIFNRYGVVLCGAMNG